MVLGNLTKRVNPFAYRTVTFYGYPFQSIQLEMTFVTLLIPSCRDHARPHDTAYTTHTSLTCTRFGLFPVRSPLLGESRLMSFPPGTEMVHFPGFTSLPYVFRQGYPDFIGVGFPIRKSPDQSLFSDSPELIAASHVLHRLPAPRHPPYALSSLSKIIRQVKKSAAVISCQRPGLFIPLPGG